MTGRSAPWLAAAVVLCGGAAAADALAGSEAQPTIWDLKIGAPATAQPNGFAEYACGTPAGPPGRPLPGGFGDYAECRPGARGLRAVSFRYDDEQELIARALEQARLIEANAGTRVFGIAVTLNALFDDAGVLRGLRIVTDPRGVPPAERNVHWTLGAMLMNRFGAEGWACETLPLGPGETAVTSHFVNDRCTRRNAEIEYVVEREYLHRRGQQFTDEFGKAFPGYFASSTAFEMISLAAP
jgi:hypothetical protein